MPDRSPDFRYIFANTIGFAWSDNECKLVFGLDEGSGPEKAFEQIGIMMTHRTAKLLAGHLSSIIESYEGHTGTEIPYDPEKAASLRKTLDEANLASNET